MGEFHFHRIEISKAESDGKHVTVIELLDNRLWGPTIMQELVHELTALLEQIEHKDILLDLVRVEYISSAALNRLINFQKRVHGAGGRLKLCNLRPSIEEVFATTRFNQVVDIHANQADALAAY